MSAPFTRSVPPSRYTPGRSGWRIGQLLAVGVGAVLTAGLVIRPRTTGRFCGKSKVDIAMLTTKKYADEAYPAYRAAHPNRVCPTDLHELNEWMNNKDTRDPWGAEYVMHCADTRDGEHMIIVRSAGEDVRFGTADDLWSNE